ncbi:MAG: hypothetical protein LPK00_11375 [Bacillaceae bacterium]|nr:hypothetical protein [Bacillaceae bacterium]
MGQLKQSNSVILQVISLELGAHITTFWINENGIVILVPLFSTTVTYPSIYIFTFSKDACSPEGKITILLVRPLLLISSLQLKRWVVIGFPFSSDKKQSVTMNNFPSLVF